jgi:hypothetical protein
MRVTCLLRLCAGYAMQGIHSRPAPSLVLISTCCAQNRAADRKTRGPEFVRHLKMPQKSAIFPRTPESFPEQGSFCNGPVFVLG